MNNKETKETFESLLEKLVHLRDKSKRVVDYFFTKYILPIFPEDKWKFYEFHWDLEGLLKDGRTWMRKDYHSSRYEAILKEGKVFIRKEGHYAYVSRPCHICPPESAHEYKWIEYEFAPAEEFIDKLPQVEPMLKFLSTVGIEGAKKIFAKEAQMERIKEKLQERMRKIGQKIYDEFEDEFFDYIECSNLACDLDSCFPDDFLLNAYDRKKEGKCDE